MTGKSFSLHNGHELRFPLLLSVPHAGRNYPAALGENLNIPAVHLQRLEDRYADRLANKAIVAGIPTIIAHRPRAWIDLNRSKSEIDIDIINGLAATHVTMPTRKVRGGLGLIPRRLSGVGELWRKKWTWDDIAERIQIDHEPYHIKVAATLEAMRSRFGYAILLDLHSMPPLDDRREPQPSIIVGDRFGRSAGSRYSEFAQAMFERTGFVTRLNHPYPGGYILERHGHPEAQIHAIQLEVDRKCYLDDTLAEPGQNLPNMAKTIKDLALELAEQASGTPLLEAAE